MIYLDIAFEDEISEFVILRLLESFKEKFCVHESYNGRGFGYIKTNIRGFNRASKIRPFLILTDLDNNKCPAVLANSWLKEQKNQNLLFRVAVKEVEAWLLGDDVGFSKFSGAPLDKIPKNPEADKDPKKTLIKLVERYGRRSLKEDIVPIGTAAIGKNYNARLMDFVMNDWNLSRAITKCDSLKRMHRRLKNFQG